MVHAAPLLLNEGLRVEVGTTFIGAANTIYGILLVLCSIFRPRGIAGALRHMKIRRTRIQNASSAGQCNVFMATFCCVRTIAAAW